MSFKCRNSIVLIPLTLFNWSVTPISKPVPITDKLVGLTMFDLISQWACSTHFYSNIIVLTNINVGAKNLQFWAKVPKVDIEHFLKDVVILHCKDRTELLRLIENIPPDFADAWGFGSGQLIQTNEA